MKILKFSSGNCKFIIKTDKKYADNNHYILYKLIKGRWRIINKFTSLSMIDLINVIQCESISDKSDFKIFHNKERLLQ